MAAPAHSLDDLRRVIERHWGYREFRPLQEQAMQAVLAGRDSLVVMPTGGGKSLCYQAPAVLRGGTAVVVSPLIALMKDQVDSLKACGVAAAQINSTLSSTEKFVSEVDLRQGSIRLLFVSPERLAMTDFCRLLQEIDVHTFAIDEAHCISHWGHDFRPEYRQMGRLKELFPRASLHAYTATATEPVRQDICKQLNMTDPLMLVGNFDRPNLTYRVLPRGDEFKQVMDVIARHRNEAGIIYCTRRADVDSLSARLTDAGVKALAYHAGMDNEERRRAQEAFAQEKCDVIVATVAFGMGINRSNIRYIIHAAMPKSIEHYQQETGRAGRDGLEAECVLLHGGGDAMTWKRILAKSTEEVEVDPNFLANANKHLDHMDMYCRNSICRHRALVEYFGQTHEGTACSACDICLGDTEPVPDSDVVAQKILSCVARVQERFGVGHVVGVLTGENTEKIRSMGHDKLTTYGLLKGSDKNDLRNWISQLIGQGVLAREGDEYPILKLNERSWEVMKKQRAVKLIRPIRQAADERAVRSKAAASSWEGVDTGLFERLRELRMDIATKIGMPPYIVHSDRTLRELARIRPSTLEKMMQVSGIGERKATQYGESFLKAIDDYCRASPLARDVGLRTVAMRQPDVGPVAVPEPKGPTGVRAVSFELFEKGFDPIDVAYQMNRSVLAVMEDLSEYIRWTAPVAIDPWLKPEKYQQVAAAVNKVGMAKLKPIYEELGGMIPYEEIRLVVAHLQAMQAGAGERGAKAP